jgi:hypothetical protein
MLKIGRRAPRKSILRFLGFFLNCELRHVTTDVQLLVTPHATYEVSFGVFAGVAGFLAHESRAVGGVGNQLRVPLRGTGPGNLAPQCSPDG